MKAIGGYFEWELGHSNEFHPRAIKLNSGRNALEYILKAKKFKKVYLPLFSCEALLQPIQTCGIAYEYYSINEHFEIAINIASIASDEALLYTNFFGLKDKYIISLASTCPTLIVDNAQAFYAYPVPGADTFYSARKFFGVPDGAYLYTNVTLPYPLQRDVSFDRCRHLLRRVDQDGESGYSDFRKHEALMNELPLRGMSQLTAQILNGLPYHSSAERRKENLRYLHNALQHINLLRAEISDDQVLLDYPLLTRQSNLRDKLISKKIFVPQYWPGVQSRADKNSVEYEYSKIIHLPIDHRYDQQDMEYIINIINDEYKR